MTEINCLRRQYSVGQGGLHLGILSYPRICNDKIEYDNFAYIYDCGCVNGRDFLRPYIDEIIKRLAKIPNLAYVYIFLSHIHNDHVNGMPYLYDRLCSLRLLPLNRIVIVMPYMEEAERMVVFSSFEEDDDFINLIDFGNNDINIQYLNDIPPLEYNYYNSLYSIPDYNIDNNLSHNNNFIFRNKQINAPCWIIRPFYNKIKKCTLENIEKELKNLNITIENFRDRENINQLRRIYENYRLDLNVSSLCLYSGTCYPANYLHTGWLHTGDINFSSFDTLEKLEMHYINQLENVRVAQIPHHGSERNSKMSDFEMFTNLKNLFVTTQDETNRSTTPNLSREYQDIAIRLTETSGTIWSYEKTSGVIWSNFS